MKETPPPMPFAQARPEDYVVAELLDAHGKALARGRAYVPGHDTVTFYPENRAEGGTVLMNAKALSLIEAATVLKVYHGRTCQCQVSGVHYHFQKVLDS